MDTQKPCCGNCLYHIKAEKNQTVCRFNPPTLFEINNVIIGTRPVVSEEDICGQWHSEYEVRIHNIPTLSDEDQKTILSRPVKIVNSKRYRQYRRDEAVRIANESIEKEKSKGDSNAVS